MSGVAREAGRADRAELMDGVKSGEAPVAEADAGANVIAAWFANLSMDLRRPMLDLVCSRASWRRTSSESGPLPAASAAARAASFFLSSRRFFLARAFCFSRSRLSSFASLLPFFFLPPLPASSSAASAASSSSSESSSASFFAEAAASSATSVCVRGRVDAMSVERMDSCRDGRNELNLDNTS